MPNVDWQTAYGKLRNDKRQTRWCPAHGRRRGHRAPRQSGRDHARGLATHFHGRRGSHAELATDFLIIYKDYLYKGEKAQIPDITGERLQAECKNAAATAASWDQWAHDK